MRKSCRLGLPLDVVLLCQFGDENCNIIREQVSPVQNPQPGQGLGLLQAALGPGKLTWAPVGRGCRRWFLACKSAENPPARMARGLSSFGSLKEALLYRPVFGGA
jgi:hypothetical protein